MGKKQKRKARKTIKDKKVDITKPVDIQLTLEELGTKKDPCFGKLNDPRNEICQRCGDCEFCAIAMGQSNHKLRKKTEEGSNFKDLEEKEIVKKLLSLPMRKKIKAKAMQILKSYKKGITLERWVLEIYGVYLNHGVSKEKISKIVLKLAENRSNIVKKQNLYICQK